MVAVLVVVSIVALLVLDYFVLRKRRERHASPLPHPQVRPLSEMVSGVPDGVFLQPTYTWSRMQENGDFLIGVHPLLLGLVGAPYQLDVLAAGEQIDVGDAFARVGRGEQRLTVRSPISGRIAEVNSVLKGEDAWSDLERVNGSWLYRVVPADAADQVPTWMVADRAREWTQSQYARLKEYLFGVQHAGELGLAMTDGGDLPAGILSSLEPEAWEAVQRDFLDVPS